MRVIQASKTLVPDIDEQRVLEWMRMLRAEVRGQPKSTAFREE